MSDQARRSGIINGIDLNKFIPLLYKRAKRHGASKPIEDSWQYAEAWLGLIRAADTYDASRGAKFITYAWNLIDQAIYNQRQRAMTAMRGGCGPEGENYGATQTHSVSQIGDKPDFDIAIDNSDPAEPVIAAEEGNRTLAEAGYLLSLLDPKSRRCVEAVVLRGQTHKAAAEVEGLSPQRIQQIVKKAIAGMRTGARAPSTAVHVRAILGDVTRQLQGPRCKRGFTVVVKCKNTRYRSSMVRSGRCPRCGQDAKPFYLCFECRQRTSVRRRLAHRRRLGVAEDLNMKLPRGVKPKIGALSR